ncbi:MAG: hypothetical protein HOW97_09680 [Catenulispora sp.]|nr:hypothetical protein [Catenulispora sp.]
MRLVVRAAWAFAALGLVALSYYLVAYRWTDVAGNLEAQVVIVTPAFAVHHVLIRRHTARLHEQTQQAIADATASPPADQ